MNLKNCLEIHSCPKGRASIDLQWTSVHPNTNNDYDICAHDVSFENFEGTNECRLHEVFSEKQWQKIWLPPTVGNPGSDVPSSDPPPPPAPSVQLALLGPCYKILHDFYRDLPNFYTIPLESHKIV